MLQIRVGHAGESFFGLVILLENDEAITFNCHKKGKIIKTKPQSINESSTEYTNRVGDEDKRIYSEVMSLDFHPHQAFFSDFDAGFDLESWAKQLCERLMDTEDAADGAPFLAEWLRWLGDVVYHPSDTPLMVCLKSLAKIPGPEWAF